MTGAQWREYEYEYECRGHRGWGLKILVLGAGGFIGAHLTERLLRERHTVVGVDTHDDKLHDLSDPSRFQFVRTDIRRSSFPLERHVDEADLVIDLIAYANPGLYVRMPLEVFRLNFMENLRIAEACVARARRLIQFSSSEVYGKTAASFLGDKLRDRDDPAHALFSEDGSPFILGPVNRHRWIYACAKQLLERVLHAYGLEDRLNYTIVRPFNFIGPKIDYLPSARGGIPRVFSFFMDALLQGSPMQLVDGGHHRRTYTYIADAIECIYRIVANRDGACDRQIFNVGSDRNEVTIRELAETMRSMYAKTFARPGEPLPDLVEVPAESFYGVGYEDSDRRIPDIAKARTLLGWEAATPLIETLERSMAYYVAEARAAPAS